MRLHAVIALVATASPALADPAPDKDARRVGLAKVWIEAKVAHPAVLRGAVDIDAPMPEVIAKVDAATTKAAYAAAIGELLGAFHDPATRVEDPAAAPTPPKVPVTWVEHPTPKIVVVTLLALAPETREKRGELVSKLPTELAGADVVVIDVRAPGLQEFSPWMIKNAEPALPPTEKVAVSRMVVHHGYRSSEPNSYTGYSSSFSLTPIARLHGDGTAKHVVFVTDSHSALPAIALALQASGRASIVSADAITDAPSVHTRDVKLPYGLLAHVRAEDLVMPDSTAVTADVIVAAPRSPHTAAIELAKAIAAGGKPPPHKPGPLAPTAVPATVDDRDWPDPAFPARELRIFAGIKLWGVIAKFYPYLDLVTDWDRELPHALAELEAAGDDQAYRDALSAYATHLHDGHLVVWRDDADLRSRPSIEVRMVEHLPVITEVNDPAAAVHVGDEVVSIDGVPIAKAREARLRTTVAGTPSARDNSALIYALAGPPDKSATLEVRGADRKIRTVSLARKRIQPPPQPHFKQLGKIGYADLGHLDQDEVDPMFAAFASSPGIIMDMRGYPHGTAWPITPHINVKKATAGAIIGEPIIEGGETGSMATEVQDLVQNPAVTVYRGKLVVLIDDRAISQAEHSCLFFEQAANVTFIGSHTHGTNGDVTTIRLPGRTRMWFTGHSIRHADGRQLQQIGILPTIPIEPTIAGIRAGKDELLERAIRFINTGK